MPTSITTGVASARCMGFILGSKPGVNEKSYCNSIINTNVGGIKVFNNKSAIAIIRDPSNGFKSGLLFLDLQGNVTSYKIESNTLSSYAFFDAWAFDSNYIYVLRKENATTEWLYKLDFNGNVILAKNVDVYDDSTNGWASTGNHLTIDSSGNLIRLRTNVIATEAYIDKYDTSLNAISGNTYVNTINSGYVINEWPGTTQIAHNYDSTVGLVYAASYSFDAACCTYQIVGRGIIHAPSKYIRYYTSSPAPYTTQIHAVNTDGSGNTYILLCQIFGPYNGNASPYYELLKLDVNGNKVWSRKFDGVAYENAGFNTVSRIVFDTAGYVYVISQSSNIYPNPNSCNFPIIAKYHPNGTIQWFRRLRATVSGGSNVDEMNLTGGYLDPQDPTHLYITANIATFIYPTPCSCYYYATSVILKVPTDGSLTQSFTLDALDYYYEAYYPSESAGSANVTSGSVTPSTYTPYVASNSDAYSASSIPTNYLHIL